MFLVHESVCSNYNKTHNEMWTVTFHEKSSLEKKLWFPENSWFFEIHNFRQNPRNWWSFDENSREFVSPQDLKMQESTSFPEFSSQNSDFSREIFVKIFSFHENLGLTFSRIPGNFGRRNVQKCRNIGVSQNSRPEIQIFPGKFLRKF